MADGASPCRQVAVPVIFATCQTDPQRAETQSVKAAIHPDYHTVTVVCACGNSWKTRSTAKSIHLEICAKCHPFFTGKQKLVDTAGRVERFRAKYRSPAES